MVVHGITMFCDTSHETEKERGPLAFFSHCEKFKMKLLGQQIRIWQMFLSKSRNKFSKFRTKAKLFCKVEKITAWPSKGADTHRESSRIKNLDQEIWTPDLHQMWVCVFVLDLGDSFSCQNQNHQPLWQNKDKGKDILNRSAVRYSAAIVKNLEWSIWTPDFTRCEWICVFVLEPETQKQRRLCLMGRETGG